MTSSDPILDLLLIQARAGDQAALGRLLELYRNYLRLMAHSLIHRPLQVRAGCLRPGSGNLSEGRTASSGNSASARGNESWWPGSARFLVRTLSNEAKHHRAQGAISAARNRSTCCWTAPARAIQEQLADSIASPQCTHAAHREQAVLMAEALPRPNCPPTTARSSSLRNLEQVPVDEIAASAMGRSPNAVQHDSGRRAMKSRLKQAMEGQS